MMFSLQQLAYQYAMKRAFLVLVARRESSLRQVADRAIELGARDVIVLPGDVANPDDCKRFVQTAISHYDRCKRDYQTNSGDVASESLLSNIAHIQWTILCAMLASRAWGRFRRFQMSKTTVPSL